MGLKKGFQKTLSDLLHQAHKALLPWASQLRTQGEKATGVIPMPGRVMSIQTRKCWTEEE